MILINTITDESWSCPTQKFIAEQIGVSEKTICEWKKTDKRKEIFNDFVVYLHPIKTKQKKGFYKTK